MRTGRSRTTTTITTTRAAIAGLATAVMTLAMFLTGAVLGPVAPASAADPLSCTGVYAIQGASPRNLWQLNTATGGQTPVGAFAIAGTNSLNGLGISNNGAAAYGVIPDISQNGRAIYQLTRSSEVTTRLGNGVAGSPVTHGAVNPQNGIYYYGGFTDGSIQVYGFDPSARTSLGLVASGTIPTGGASGDWAFDQQGRLYVVGGAGGTNIVSVIDQDIPTRAGTSITVTGTQLTQITTGRNDAINGIAFGADGFLYLGSGVRMYQADPVTGRVVNDYALTLTGSVDFASCASPSTLTVYKNLPNGRVAATDQVTVTIAGGGVTQNNTGTTQGTETGVQNQAPTEYAGPVFVRSGTQYTISESGTAATSPGYISTWTCVNTNTGTTIASGTGTSGTFTMPSGGAAGVAAECTFTNAAQIPAISLVKTAGTPTGATPGATVAYSFLVTNTGNVPLATTTISDPKVGPVTCPTGVLAAGASRTCTAAPYVLTQADVDNGSVINTATVTGTPVTAGLPTVRARSTVTTPIAQNPVLTLVKSADTPVDVNGSGLVDAGDTVGYSFAVTNEGNVPLTGLVVVDPIVGATTCAATTLAPGASTTCATDARYVITVGDENVGAVVNTARVRGTTPLGLTVQSNQSSTTTPVQTPAPGLEIVKSFDPAVDVNASGIVDAGDTVLFRFAVTNTGNVPVSALTVIDPVLADLGIGITCEDTTLAVEGSTTCVADAPYTITGADGSAGAVTNSARANGDDPDGGDVTSPPSSVTVPVTTPVPHLTIDKRAGDPVDVNGSGITDAGDTVAYTFAVTNDGNVPITGLTILDPKLTGSGVAISCPTTTLAVGASTTCTTSTPYVVTAQDELDTVVANTARAAGTDPDGGGVTSDPDSTNTPVTEQSLALTLDKQAGAPVDVNSSGLTDAGDTIEYTFVVTNHGNVSISGIEIDDPKLAAAGLTISCDPDTLAPEASVTCEADGPYVITEADEAAGVAENVATAQGEGPDGDDVVSNEDSTRSIPVIAGAPALSVEKTAAAPIDVNSSGLVDAGDTIAYTFTVTNTGNVPISGITIDDPWLEAADVDIVCGATSLAPQAVTTCSAVYTIVEDDETAGSVDNVATANGTDPDGDPVDSPQDDVTTPVDQPTPELTLVKTASPAQDVNGSGITDAGDTILYTFTVTNSGNVPVRLLGINDPLLDGIDCDLVALFPAQSTTCLSTEPYVITDADVDAGEIVNTAQANAQDPDGDTVLSNEDSTVTETQEQDLGLSVVKTAGDPVDVNDSGITDAGDTILFTFEVTNDSNVPVSAVAIDDPMLTAAGILVRCDVITLRPGESTSCQATEPYVITGADETAGAVENSATADAVGPDGDPIGSEPGTTTTPVVIPAPSLAILKEVAEVTDVNDSGITDAGDTITYLFTVTNTGNVPLSEVAVVDPRLGDVTCEDATLAVEGSTRCTAAAAYVVTAADELAGEAANVAHATAVDPDGGAVRSEPDDATVPAAVPAPELEIVKSADDPEDVNGSGIVDAGDTVLFSFVVTNTGNVPVSGIAVQDAMLADAGIDIVCDQTTLGVDASTDCVAQARYTITAAQEAATVVRNTATATGTSPDGDDVVSDPDTHSEPVTPQAPVLTLDKFAGDPVDVNDSGITDAGDTIQYTFTVTNDGNVPMTGIAISDGKLDAQGIGITCQATDLAIGESTECAADAPYVVTEDDEVAGEVVNTATATGVDPDGDPTDSNEAVTTTTPVIAPDPVLEFVKEAGAPQDVNGNGVTDAGDTILFTFTVTNAGNVPVDDIAIDDPMLEDTGVDVTCQVVRLLPGQATFCDALYEITAADVDAGEVANVATANGTDPDGGGVPSAPDDTTTPIEPVPGIEIAKTATLEDGDDDGRADVGESIVYTFAVTNTGNVSLTDVGVDDPLAGPVTCETTTLAAGASTTCEADAPYPITQDDVDAGAVINVATATGTPPGGVDPIGSDEATTSTPADARASIALEKSSALADGGDSAAVGDVIEYAFLVTNTGTVTLDTLVVDDPMLAAADADITCPEGTLAAGAETTCTAQYTVTQADVDAGGDLVNVATAVACAPVTGTDPGECLEGKSPVVSPESATRTPVAQPLPPEPTDPPTGSPSEPTDPPTGSPSEPTDPPTGSPSEPPTLGVPEMPGTGASVGGQIGLAVALLGAGAWLLVRRRRSATHG